MYIFHFVETYTCFLEKVVEGTYLGFLAAWLIVGERYSCDAFKHGTITRSGITRYFVTWLALNKNHKMFRYQATKKKRKKSEFSTKFVRIIVTIAYMWTHPHWVGATLISCNLAAKIILFDITQTCSKSTALKSLCRKYVKVYLPSKLIDTLLKFK